MKLLFIPIVLLCLAACNKGSKNAYSKNNQQVADTAISPCILAMIEKLKAEPKQNPPAVVYEYSYKDQKVYYVTADCCDQFNLLYDSNCNVLCAPDGGITGGGDGKCADFFESRKNERLIWKDDR